MSSGYDSEALIRAICNCRVYGLSSAPNGSNAKDRRSFARHYPGRMSAEVLLDAIAQVYGTVPDPVRGIAGRGPRAIELPDGDLATTVKRRVRNDPSATPLANASTSATPLEPEPDKDIICGTGEMPRSFSSSIDV